MAQLSISRWKRAALALKLETTYGVDAAAAAVDIIEARNVTAIVNQQQFRDERISGQVADLPDIPGARWGTISAEALIIGTTPTAYSATVKPTIDPILRALGHAAAFSATPTPQWTYTPQAGATMGESLTARMSVENSPQYIFLGCLGTGRFLFRAGEPVVLAFTLTGLYVAPTDVALITATPSAIQPPTFKSAALAIGAVSHRVSSLELDCGNDVQTRIDANDSRAISGVLIAWRRSLMRLDPEAVPVSTQDLHAIRDAATKLAFTAEAGATQYNRTKLTAPALQILDVREVQRNGLRAYELSGKPNPVSGGDEYSLLFN